MSRISRLGQWGVIVGAGAAALGVIGLILFEAPAEAPDRTAVAPKTAPAPVGLVPWTEGKADRLLKEETVLRDPTPLFLPTGWNAVDAMLPAELRREPGSQFQGYPAQLQFAETELSLSFPSEVVAPKRSAEGLGWDRPDHPFGGLGEGEGKVEALAPRDGFVEVTAAGDGRVMLAEVLKGARPPTEGSWQPLEFLVAVDAAGLVRPPVLTESSRVAAVDVFFQDFLGKVLHIGERLPPGFYRVAIGP